MCAKIGLVGLGRRAQFFLRIIHALPERFELAGGCARSAESRERFTREWGAPAFDDVDRMLDTTQPDFIISSVPRASNETVNLELLERDVPLLLETPPAESLEGLSRVWEKAQARHAPVGVAEQYIFRPYHRLTLALIERGLIGTVHHAHVSIAHGYHGASLMRHILGTGLTPPEAVTGMQSCERVEIEGQIREFSHPVALFRFAGGKMGILDFTTPQYMTALRPLGLRVRGTRGEIDNYQVAWLTDGTAEGGNTTKDKGRAVRAMIERDEAGHDGNLDGFYLKGLTLGETAHWVNPFAPARLSDEEIAIAHCMASMAPITPAEGVTAEGIASSPRLGKPAYPLIEGLFDQYLSLLWQHTAEANGAPVEIPAPAFLS